MSIPDKVADKAIEIALDDSHGYDQGSRWGNPDFDCSALIIWLFKLFGVLLTSTYTGNMKLDFLEHGFVNVTYDVDLLTGSGLKRGDVLLNELHHTALYVGDGKIVHATGNEFGGITGGQPGDQTGREICIAPYFNYPGGWDCVLRYEDSDSSDSSDDATYVVKKGDSLWSIATEHGMTVHELAALNNLDISKIIYPGQVLKLRRIDEPDEPDNAYVVKSGDSLWQIAANELGNGWSWYKIANANGLKFPYTIYPGQRLKIPKEK